MGNDRAEPRLQDLCLIVTNWRLFESFLVVCRRQFGRLASTHEHDSYSNEVRSLCLSVSAHSVCVQRRLLAEETCSFFLARFAASLLAQQLVHLGEFHANAFIVQPIPD